MATYKTDIGDLDLDKQYEAISDLLYEGNIVWTYAVFTGDLYPAFTSAVYYTTGEDDMGDLDFSDVPEDVKAEAAAISVRASNGTELWYTVDHWNYQSNAPVVGPVENLTGQSETSAALLIADMLGGIAALQG